MNEELKIIITAVSEEAKKNLADVRKELDGMKSSGKEAGKSVDTAMKGVAKGVAVAAAAIVALTAAMKQLGQSAQEVNKGFGKLKSSFENAGSSAKQATKYYKELFGILGDHDRTIETGQSLSRITTDENALGDYKNIIAGAYAQYGDGYNSEALAENIAETAAAAKITGDLERVLLEAGISIDGFNAALEQANSLEEREVLIRSTLNGVLGQAGKAYIAANQGAIAYNESQARLNIALSEASAYTAPLLTSLNDLSTSLLTVLAPALSTVAIYLTAFIQLMAEAIEWVGGFFGLFSSSAEKTTADVAGYRAATQKYLEGLRKSFGSTEQGIDNNLDKIKELKRQAMGFDELNIVSSQTSVSSGSSTGAFGSGGITSGLTAPNPEDYGIGGDIIDIEGFKKDIEEAKKELKVLLPILGAVSAAIGLWKLGSFLSELKEAKDLSDFLRGTLDGMRKQDPTGMGVLPDDDSTNKMKADLEEAETKVSGFIGKLKTVAGIGLIIAGAFVSIKSAVSSWTEGLDWDSFTGILVGLGMVVGGLALLFGGWGAAIGAAISGIIMVVLAIKDLITEGYNLKNGLLLVIGAMFAFPTPITMIVGAIYLMWNEWEGFRQFFIDLWEKLKKAVQDAKDWFVKNILEPLAYIYQTWVKPVIDKIVEIIAKIIEIIGALFVGLWNLLKIKVIQPMAEGFKKLWEDIKEFFAPAVEFFGNIFKKAYQKIKEVFEPIKNFFSGLWESIKEKFMSLATIIGDAISKAVKTGLNAVISLVEGAINKAIGLINGAIDLINKLPGVHVEKLTELQLPRLAHGGIATKSVVANIGEAGREAVLPLENNTGWMDVLADRIMSRQGAASRIVLQVDGRELGYAAINGINGITRQTGTLQLNLV